MSFFFFFFFLPFLFFFFFSFLFFLVFFFFPLLSVNTKQISFADMFKEPPRGPLAMIMMTTHSLTHVGHEIMGDPLETKIFFATSSKLEEPHVTSGFDNTYKAILRSTSLGVRFPLSLSLSLSLFLSLFLFLFLLLSFFSFHVLTTYNTQ